MPRHVRERLPACSKSITITWDHFLFHGIASFPLSSSLSFHTSSTLAAPPILAVQASPNRPATRIRIHFHQLRRHLQCRLLVSIFLSAQEQSDSHRPEQIRTTVTDLLKIRHPVLLAGMNVAAGPKLAAAVTNAGGLGVIGGVGTCAIFSRATGHSCSYRSATHQICSENRYPS